MKALVVHELGGPDKLSYEDVPEPEVGAGQVLVDVQAAGVNFPDLLLCRGAYQFQPERPFSPGGEVAGVVRAVGDGVERLAVGQRVVGLGIWGGFAERMLLGEERVLPLPDEVSFEVGAALTTTYGTMVHAYEDRAKLSPGETVLVLGAAGGVGTAAIEVAKLMGAKVVAAASSPEKLAVCRELGADELLDYATEDLKKRAKALTGGGADVVVDPVGGSYAEPALRATAWEGRFLVIGFAAGEIPKIPLNLTLLKGCSIVGVFWGSFLAREPERATEQLLRIGRWVAEGKLEPRVSRTYPLAEGAKALEALAAREVTGKVVLVPGG
ncbi:MAG TPA: NADPH:quinone oxidoreductase family protein [Sandaracinaceae bacterium LLY-WYZ-13_1]|nr:NADPH:quinone oxidoreductase family protein [Sandaracinaceae bacterium LLY-WYZ-13_1]